MCVQWTEEIKVAFCWLNILSSKKSYITHFAFQMSFLLILKYINTYTHSYIYSFIICLLSFFTGQAPLNSISDASEFELLHITKLELLMKLWISELKLSYALLKFRLHSSAVCYRANNRVQVLVCIFFQQKLSNILQILYPITQSRTCWSLHMFFNISL